MIKYDCCFYREEQDGHATIRDCYLRDDGKVYPSNAPQCEHCENYYTHEEVKMMLEFWRRSQKELLE